MTEEKRDYYDVLGISKDASETDIKRAYRQLAKKYHPDSNPGDKEAEVKFKEASEAYAILSDADKRKKYDQFGHSAFNNGSGFTEADFGSVNFTDIFSDLFGTGFGGLHGFDAFGSAYSQPNNVARKGADVRATLNISFMESVTGCIKSLQGNYKDTCTTCNGSGCKPGTTKDTCSTCKGTGKMVSTTRTPFGVAQSITPCTSCGGLGAVVKDKCKVCNGIGYKKIKKTFKITIPAGIENGMAVRLAECGEPGINGGPRGDLLVFVAVADHPKFKRSGLNVYSEEHIPFTMAILGGAIEADTIYGKEPISIPAGTQSYTEIKLPEKGFTHVNNSASKGTHIITIIVDIPTSLTTKQKKLIEDYTKL